MVGFAVQSPDLQTQLRFFLQGTHAISFIYSSLLNLSLISKKPTQQLITSEKATFLSIESFGLLLQCAYPVSRKNDERMCWSQTKGKKSLDVNTCNLNNWEILSQLRKWFESRVTYFDWKRSPRWLESWEGLLFVTDVSTCVEASFRIHLTLKMAFTQVVETSVAKNIPSQDSSHPDDLFQSRYSLSY